MRHRTCACTLYHSLNRRRTPGRGGDRITNISCHPHFAHAQVMCVRRLHRMSHTAGRNEQGDKQRAAVLVHMNDCLCFCFVCVPATVHFCQIARLVGRARRHVLGEHRPFPRRPTKHPPRAGQRRRFGICPARMCPGLRGGRPSWNAVCAGARAGR